MRQFTFTVYTCSHLFLCTNTAEEACLSIARTKDASVKMLHMQLIFPWFVSDHTEAENDITVHSWLRVHVHDYLFTFSIADPSMLRKLV